MFRSHSSRRLFVLLSLASLASVCLVSAVHADDLNPPPWRTNPPQPLSTSAEWDFNAAANVQPDGNSVPLVIGDGLGPNGVPLMSPGPGLTWVDFNGTGNGGWSGGAQGGQMTFDVPNWIDHEPLKLIWAQFTYFQPPGTTFPGVHILNITPSDPQPITDVSLINFTDTASPTTPGLVHRLERWQIRPNPDWERIVIGIPPETILLQTVIDTISIPEPSSFVLAGLAAVTIGLAARRRRASRV